MNIYFLCALSDGLLFPQREKFEKHHRYTFKNMSDLGPLYIYSMGGNAQDETCPKFYHTECTCQVSKWFKNTFEIMNGIRYKYIRYTFLQREISIQWVTHWYKNTYPIPKASLHWSNGIRSGYIAGKNDAKMETRNLTVCRPYFTVLSQGSTKGTLKLT